MEGSAKTRRTKEVPPHPPEHCSLNQDERGEEKPGAGGRGAWRHTGTWRTWPSGPHALAVCCQPAAACLSPLPWRLLGGTWRDGSGAPTCGPKAAVLRAPPQGLWLCGWDRQGGKSRRVPHPASSYPAFACPITLGLGRRKTPPRMLGQKASKRQQ